MRHICDQLRLHALAPDLFLHRFRKTFPDRIDRSCLLFTLTAELLRRQLRPDLTGSNLLQCVCNLILPSNPPKRQYQGNSIEQKNRHGSQETGQAAHPAVPRLRENPAEQHTQRSVRQDIEHGADDLPQPPLADPPTVRCQRDNRPANCALRPIFLLPVSSNDTFHTEQQPQPGGETAGHSRSQQILIL